jgi:hypothetical protein
MAESHALLIPVENRDNLRKFDHLEFKNFFISKSLINLVIDYLSTDNATSIKKFLSIAQLPDSVARYCSKRVDCKNIDQLISKFNKMVLDEWKPTYLQANIGTLIPFILDDYHPGKTLKIENRITFSSLIFEAKNLNNIEFNSCNFINISFKDSLLNNLAFNNSTFNEIRIYEHSKNVFNNVFFNNCIITAIIIIDELEVSYSEYSPKGIKSVLVEFGFVLKDDLESKEEENIVVNPKFKKYVKKFITKFNSSTYQYEKDIEDEISFSGYSDIIIQEIIPILVKYNIIETKETKKSKQASSRAWRLIFRDIPAIFKSEEEKTSPLFDFWREVNSHE